MNAREQLVDELRSTAFGIAYRMPGSVSEAEDAVQEALLRVHRTLEAGEHIASPRAFVATVTTRLAINELRSARVRRERDVGQWLPEPIITDGHDDPATHAETADSLSLASLVLLASLSPQQRACCCCTTCSATATRRSPSSWARPRATPASSPHAPGGNHDATTTLPDDAGAARRARAAVLRSRRERRPRHTRALLAHDVELTGDGGGKTPAMAHTLRGRARAARTIIA